MRDNLATLKNTGEAKQLVARYIAKAGEQETRLEQMAREKREAQAELNRLLAEFDVAVRALVIDRRLN